MRIFSFQRAPIEHNTYGVFKNGVPESFNTVELLDIVERGCPADVSSARAELIHRAEYAEGPALVRLCRKEKALSYNNGLEDGLAEGFADGVNYVYDNELYYD